MEDALHDGKDRLFPQINIQHTLAIVVTFGFFSILAYLIRFGVPVQGGEPLLVMLGSLGTAWTMIISFFFGSTSGSQRKDAVISDMAATAKPPV